jgi:poly(3-hydroxybutyrate) depolymerase
MGYGKTGRMISTCLSVVLVCSFMLACNPEKARSRDKPAESGTREMSIVVNGLERTYLVHVPAAYKPQIPLPLVIMLHGGGIVGPDRGHCACGWRVVV